MTWTVRMEEIPRRSWTFFLSAEVIRRILKRGRNGIPVGNPVLDFLDRHLMRKVFNPDQIGGEQRLYLQYPRVRLNTLSINQEQALHHIPSSFRINSLARASSRPEAFRAVGPASLP